MASNRVRTASLGISIVLISSLLSLQGRLENTFIPDRSLWGQTIATEEEYKDGLSNHLLEGDKSIWQDKVVLEEVSSEGEQVNKVESTSTVEGGELPNSNDIDESKTTDTSASKVDTQTLSNTLHNKQETIEKGDPLIFPDEKDTNGNQDLRPRNLRLAIIGDSVSGYQYVSLMYYLKTNKWYTDEPRPNLLFKKTYPTWYDYLVESHQTLSPEEQCDCQLPPGKFYMSTSTINRYYRDEAMGNYITFLNKYGSRDAHGHWSSDQVFQSHTPLKDRPRAFQNYTWSGNWSYAISEHLAQLEPKPDFLLFNAGLHPNRLGRKEVHRDILAACKRYAIIPIFKTTTTPMNTDRKTRFQRGGNDRFLCQVFPHCLDFSWTRDYVGEEYYWDQNHMKGAMNTRMNLDLLELLRKLAGHKDMSAFQEYKDSTVQYPVEVQPARLRK